jgi:hypothetical protein
MRSSHDTQISAAPLTPNVMSADDHDVLRHIAEQVADRFADSGYAFVEEDKIDGLAATLGSFLSLAGIPVNPPARAT